MAVMSALFACALFLLSFPARLIAAEWYVAPPPLGSDSNSGTEENPFATIQKGIDAASEQDTVIVAQGTYLENIQFKGKNIVLRSADPADRTVVENTVIDGDMAGAVVTLVGTEDGGCVLSGFTVRNGEAWEGGGICGGTAEQHTLATIENSIIADNAAQFGGGGLAYCDGAIRRNIISGNSGGFVGGGGLSECDGLIVNNVIAGNSGGLSGGGLYGCDGTI